MFTGYMWTDRSSVQTLNWAQGEPNDYGGAEDCVEMDASTGLWNDENCAAHRSWICSIRRGQGTH